MTLRADLLMKIEELTDLVLLLPEDDGQPAEPTEPVDPEIPLPRLNNGAEWYGVTVQPRYASRDTWRAVNIRHLNPGENRGGHAVHVILRHPNGMELSRDERRDLRIGWTWEGRNPAQSAPPKPLDKPVGLLEKGHGNVDLYLGMTARVWIERAGSPGQPLSDIVVGLHSNHPDELGPNGEIWNSIGHHSFVIVFQYVP